MSTCRRCQTRISLTKPLASASSQSSFFSTTIAIRAQSARPGAEARGKKTLRLGKRKIENRGRAPNQGERIAIRKRIVLSNTNAFEVQGLKEWSGENYADSGLEGSMVAFSGAVVDSLRAIESFKPSQGWGFFRRPATLMRQETIDIARYIQECTDNHGKGTHRKLIVGDRGSGKSVLLLQAQAIAFQARWVVIHIPEAQDLTNGTTQYAPFEGSNPLQYIQKTYTAGLLERIARGNKSVLSEMQLSQEHKLPVPVQSNMSLDRLAGMGAENPELSWPIFQALWSELIASGRPPILLSMDNVAHVSRLSNYLTPKMYNIHSFDLALVDHFIAYLSDAKSLPNGGLVLASDSGSNRPLSPSLDLVIRRTEAKLANVAELPLFDVDSPYDKHDPRVLKAFETLEVVRLKGLDSAEAKVVLEYYAKSGMLRRTVTDELVIERRAISGGGIIGELERSSIRALG